MAQAPARLTLDWDKPLRLDAFRKTIWTPAVLRANRIAKETAEQGQVPVTVPPGVTPYALRHTYASLSLPQALSRSRYPVGWGTLPSR